jgi:hypothetical protein
MTAVAASGVTSASCASSVDTEPCARDVARIIGEEMYGQGGDLLGGLLTLMETTTGAPSGIGRAPISSESLSTVETAAAGATNPRPEML